MFSRVLPGVHAVQPGRELTALQRDQAALLYAGGLSVITSRAALVSRRLAAADTPVLDGDGVRVLIPHTTRRVSAGFVVVERTRFMPAHHERDGLRYTPVARAVLDPDPPTSLFVVHFATTWIVVWLMAIGPIRMLFIRWRFKGGRIT